LGRKVKQSCELQIDRACRVEMVNKENMSECVIKVFNFSCVIGVEEEK